MKFPQLETQRDIDREVMITKIKRRAVDTFAGVCFTLITVAGFIVLLGL